MSLPHWTKRDYREENVKQSGMQNIQNKWRKDCLSGAAMRKSQIPRKKKVKGGKTVEERKKGGGIQFYQHKKNEFV